MDFGLLREALGWALLMGGGFFVLTGAIGIVRFPDFYTRMHAAGITDTLGADLMLLGMVVMSPSWVVAVKLLIIGAFMLFTSPVSTHALAHAAWVGGQPPLIGRGLKPYGGPEQGAGEGEGV